MKITINLENEGLNCIFKPYQKRIMEYLWSQSDHRSSADVWNAVGPETISRASVINTLQWLADLGFLKRTTITGKGGHRGLYQANIPEGRILSAVGAESLKRLGLDI